MTIDCEERKQSYQILTKWLIDANWPSKVLPEVVIALGLLSNAIISSEQLPKTAGSQRIFPTALANIVACDSPTLATGCILLHKALHPITKPLPLLYKMFYKMPLAKFIKINDL